MEPNQPLPTPRGVFDSTTPRTIGESSTDGALPALGGEPLYIRSLPRLEAVRGDSASPKVERFIESVYGIEGFSELVDQHFPKVGPHLRALLPRQILTPCTESVSAVLLSRLLNLSPILGAFSGDTFHPSSVDKSAALKTRMLRWKKTSKGAVVCEPRIVHLVSEPLEALSGRVIDSLKTAEGKPVIEHHSENLQRVVGQGCFADATEFFHECLKRAKRRPEECFVRDANNMCVRMRTVDVDLERVHPRDVRPPAKWYYPIMFSLFIDKLVLFETYENPRGSVSAARALFTETSDMLLRATGSRPRVIEIPPLSREMLAMNEHVLEGGAGAFIELMRRSEKRADEMGLFSRPESVDILALAQAISDEVLTYGRETLL